jgi:hypothetical protein
MSFLGLGVGLFVGWLLNLVARRAVISPAIPAFVGIGLAMVAGLVLVFQAMSRSVNSAPDTFNQGELVGTVFGSALVPLIVAFLVHRSFSKRRGLPDPSLQRAPSAGR